METQTFEPRDIINFAAGKDAAKLSAAFNELIGQRVYDAIQARKIEVAKQMFNDDEEIKDTEEEQPSIEASADPGQETEVSAEQQVDQETEESDETAQ